ncbi:MAG: cation transporter [Halomonadaceae bacterium]|nr:MAG: cation transporter [Halomonadaceae bacterium]
MAEPLQQTSTVDSGTQESRAARKVTLVGLVLDVLLGLSKVITGLLYNSHALVADGIHSFSDVASDIMVLVLFRFSREAPDHNHPYGHERFETIGTVIMGSLLIAVAGALAWDSVQRLVGGDLSVPGWPVLVVALFSLLSKEWIFRYTRRVGRRIRSDLLLANAWHSRSDAFSSGVVMVGAGGAMLGFPWLDGVAAIVIALIVGKIGWSLAWDNVKELVDTAMPEADQARLYQIAESTEGVKQINSVRSRRMGTDFLLDIHLQVDPRISVSEGHQVGIKTTHRILENLPQVREVTFHIDAEDEGPAHDHSLPELPLRTEVLEALNYRWRDVIDFDRVKPIRLHYLNAKISVELFLSGDEALRESQPNAESLAQQLRRQASDLHWLGQVRVWYAEQDSQA